MAYWLHAAVLCAWIFSFILVNARVKEVINALEKYQGLLTEKEQVPW